MPDWTASMQQTFEFYEVDPGTWKEMRRIDTVISCTINRDADAETLGSASFDVSETLGECYIRVYLITIQNGVRERIPLGTYLVETPSSSFDGKYTSITMDAYTPLIELKEKMPELGYSIYKEDETNIMARAYDLTAENVRAPVVETADDEVMTYDFVANTDDTWLSFLTDFIANADYTFALDELGRILFAPDQDTASLQPVWTYTDDNSSILQPSLDLDHDLYGVPNVVEVIYSTYEKSYYARVVNDDASSPTSTVARGREIVYRVDDPDISGNPTADSVQEYAEKLLRQQSSIEYTVTYTHGYCPVNIGDCVRLNYTRSGLNGVKAKVTSQSISCESGCQVTETAVYTTKLWR